MASQPAPNLLQDQKLGILLLLLSILAFTLMDATAKYLAPRYDTVQIVWVRYTVNLLIVLALVGRGLPRVLRSNAPLVQALRGLAQLASVMLFFASLAYIGLAEATAIMDTNPVLITLFAALFLGERIGPRRIMGIGAALVGALIIIRPGSGVFHPAALLPLIGAFTFAAGAILTRLARVDGTMTSILWTARIGAGLTSAAVPFFWTPIAAGDLWAFALVGMLGTLSQVLLIRAFALAEAGMIAPFVYTGLLWASLWGWLFWGVLPDRWTVMGALIIAGAGLYVWTREARAMKGQE